MAALSAEAAHAPAGQASTTLACAAHQAVSRMQATVRWHAGGDGEADPHQQARWRQQSVLPE